MIRIPISYRCIFIFMCLVLLTGCWDSKEMDDLALVMASGLDLTDEGQLEGTIQIALPTGIPSTLQTGGKGTEHVLVISMKGKDGVDVLSRLQQLLSRRIFLGHRGVIVVGENYARQGIDQVMDNMLRSPDSRYNSYIVTASGATAKEILNVPYKLEQIPAIAINKMEFIRASRAVKIDEFLSSLASHAESPVTGAIRIKKDDTGEPIFLLDQAAVYKENKLAGFLSGLELKIYRWTKGEGNTMAITFQLEPPKDKEAKGTIGLRTLKARSKIRTFIKNGKPEATIELIASSRLLENDTKLDVSKPDILKRIEERAKKEVQKAAEKLVSDSQKKFKADIFGLGREINIQHPYAWKGMKDKWNSIFPKVAITVKTSITIERIGRTQAPAHLEKP